MSGGIGDLAVTLPELSVGPSVAGIDGSGGMTAIPALDQAQPGPLTDQQALINTANRLGVNPRDLATVISYESAGTFSPSIWGGKGGNYAGLIQFGPNERKQYGASPDQTFQEQLPAVERYLTDRGFKPGMGIMDLYSTINAGRPGRYNASDAGNGGAPGTVADKVNNQFGPHYAKADKFLEGTSYASGGAASSTTPGTANPGMSVGSTAGGATFGLNGIQTQGGPVAGQAAAPDVPSLGAQPMTAMAPTAQTMMPAGAGAAPTDQQSLLQKLLANNSNPLSSLAGAAGKAGQQQKQGQQKAGGMQMGQPYKPQTIGLQAARALFDPSRFYQALQQAGIRTGGQ
jgi:hypothetical protein